MGVPKKRTTKARQGNRRSHHAIAGMAFSRCVKCGNSTLPHRICENCGTYRQREAINVFAKLDKKERKRKEKEQAQYEKEHPEATQAASGAGSLEELSKK
jgi:large subunit ribosomal protein L32